MPKLPRFLSTAVAAALAAAALGATPALASHSQLNFFEATNTLLNGSTRGRAFATLQHLGVKALRVELYWHDVAPAANSATKPHFDAASPNSYAWGAYDAILNEAHLLGWKVLLTITSPVPRWATSNHRAPYVTRPDDKDFQEFVTAVALRYNADVSVYSIWNEPNHPAFLLPQFNSHGSPASPRIYRGLYQAAYAGLQAAGIAHPNILFGETAPTGYTRVSRRIGLLHDVAPLAFLREALCLNNHYVKSRSCGLVQMTGYAHHAYTKAVPPTFGESGSPDDVVLGDISRLSRALDLAARAGAIPARVPMYLTEFGVQSFPNRFLGVSAPVQAERDAWAEQIAWSNPRVAAFSQYLLKDDPTGGPPGSSVHGGTVGFQTGLEYVNGRPKPLFFGWPVPLSVAHRGHGFVLWGLVRPTNGPTQVTVLVKTRHAKRYRTLKTVNTDGAGYWILGSTVRGEVWRVRWISPSGARYEGPPVHAH